MADWRVLKNNVWHLKRCQLVIGNTLGYKVEPPQYKKQKLRTNTNLDTLKIENPYTKRSV